MEKIEIYSSKKKSLLLLIASLIFVIGGIYMFVNAENLTGYRAKSPIFMKGIGIISVLFFGFGIYVSIKRLIQNQLMLIIDKTGVNLSPKKSLSERIEWKNIEGFSEIKIQGTKIVLIDVNNSDYWIEKEENIIRKKLIKYNVDNYGSPFNFSANSMQMNHAELMKTLNENLNKHKNIT
ncbi:STM3941 family protein [Flavobacterium aestivum]|uniref:STM3941 family protein n=1 Tax=Flavobacterium aestivum TaxID=3003257 RepID=UPI002285E34D|nr:STM3941 family protein [Flavobacterium aestivum]